MKTFTLSRSRSPFLSTTNHLHDFPSPYELPPGFPTDPHLATPSRTVFRPCHSSQVGSRLSAVPNSTSSSGLLEVSRKTSCRLGRHAVDKHVSWRQGVAQRRWSHEIAKSGAELER